MIKRNLLLVFIFVAVVLAAFLVRYLLLGSALVVSLKPAPTLVGQVAQSITDSNDEDQGTFSSSNFILKDTRYFDGGTWAVTNINYPDKEPASGWIIMQRVGQFYQVVTGPFNSISTSSLSGLPADVISYLESQGAISNVQK